MTNRNYLKPETDVDVQPEGLSKELLPRDLIEYESRLKDALAQFIKFDAHSLYFPVGTPDCSPKWLENEKKLLLPLVYKNKPLGIFAASGVELRHEHLEILGKIGALCLDNLALFKAGLIDSGSGLYLKECLLQRIAAAIESLQDSMLASKTEPALGAYGTSSGLSKPVPEGLGNMLANPLGNNFAVMSVNFSPLAKVSREYGYAFADRFNLCLAQAFRSGLPEHALAASAGDNMFAVYLPGKTPSDCLRLGREICAKMSAVQLTDPLTKSIVSLPVAVGFACYPQDMDITAFGAVKPSLEQARQILEKAALAAARAWDSPQSAAESEGQIHLLGFNEILIHGGKVMNVLPMSRVELNIGAATGAREGLHFRIVGLGEGPAVTHTVGEIVISAVQENRSVAEVVGLNDPTRPVRPGDRLELLTDFGLNCLRNPGTANGYGLDIPANLLNHRNFLGRFAEKRETCSRFCLALLRIFTGEELNPEQGKAEPEAEILRETFSGILTEFADLLEKGAFSAQYGSHSLILFTPDISAAELTERLKITAGNLENKYGVELVAGVASYPWLNYRKSDVMANAGKALDFALLLGKPRIGEVNSLALNIRADRHFSHGDIFEAIQEYKQALLADEQNVWAWTSLGVCLANIGNREEARHAFETAVSKNPADLMALYNLAQAMQAEGDYAEAKLHYEHCLQIDPEHVFSMLRLGQIAENLGNIQEAEAYYLQAGKYPQGEAPAYRQLARMALSEHRPDTAREHLHRTLAKNPHDPVALAMLAEIYLSQGDNPEIALSLVRQSVALRPDYTLGWLGLANAYAACGLPEQAERARLRAAEL